MSRVQSSNRNYLHKSRIDRHALNIVDKLQKSGFTTYLVGGCVRDLLAGVTPKDYDIGTSALPQQVRKKVPGSYIIGRRFQLVLVKRADHQFEVATFRKDQTQILPEAENTDPNLSVSDDKVTDGGTPETPVTVEAPDHLELRKLGDNFLVHPKKTPNAVTSQ